jgi:hypothetical protein
MFIDGLKADLKFILRDPLIVVASIIPLVLIIVIKLILPLFSNYIFQSTGFLPDRYFPLVSITLVSVIPLVFGMVYNITLDNSSFNETNRTHNDRRTRLFLKMTGAAFCSFIMLLITVFMTDPVPFEGWLRKLFVIILFSLQAPFVLMFISSLTGKKIKTGTLIKIYGIFLATIPFGLLVHHPWNYFVFFSPLYWISWAWICNSPFESLVYGAISILITFGCVIWLVNHFMKKI